MKQNSEKTLPGLAEIGLGLEDLIRRGARDVIQQAVEAELAQLLEQYANVKALTGQRAVVRKKNRDRFIFRPVKGMLRRGLLRMEKEYAKDGQGSAGELSASHRPART
jgi:hypothetical protein